MTPDPRTCIDCGGALPPHKTRPALRCQDCNKIKRRIKQRPTVVCMDCQTTFSPEPASGRLPERCAPCKVARKKASQSERSRRWRATNTERYRALAREAANRQRQKPGYQAKRNEYEMLRKYGISAAEFDQMLEEQGGVCAICAGPRSGPGNRFHVDHCHDSNKVRGLLCGNCNTAIGLLGDDPERAEKAAAYLRR